VNEIMRIEDAIKRVHSLPDSWVRVKQTRKRRPSAHSGIK